MPRVQIPSSNIGQGAILNRGSTSQSSLSNLRGTVILPNISAPYTIRGSNTNPYYYFWTYVVTSNTSAGSVGITYPYSEGPNESAGTIRNVFTAVYSYITIEAYTAYGYEFDSWTANSPIGPVVSYSQAYNLYYNDTYYNSNIYDNFY